MRHPFYELARTLISAGHAEFIREWNALIEKNWDGKRGPMNFIDMFMDRYKRAESPASYWRWSAIAGLAATLRDNVYLQLGHRSIYPNIYVILVGGSGMRKGAPLTAMEDLLNEVKNTKKIGGRISIQQAMRVLAETVTMSKPGANGYMLSGASAILYSEELASFLVEDPATIPILTDLYDFHKEYQDQRVSTGSVILERTCLTLLAGSNPHFLKEVYNEHARRGGLLARTILIVENKIRPRNSGVYDPPLPPPTDLIDHLKNVAKLKGPMEMDDEAKEAFDQWYSTLGELDESETGIKNRIHTSVVKVAMSLVVAEKNPVLLMKKKHVEEAIQLGIGILPNYDFMTATGNTSTSKIGPLIISALCVAPNYTMTKKALVNKFKFDVEFRDFEGVQLTLVQAGVIEVTANAKGEPAFRLSKENIEIYEQQKKKAEKK